MLLMAIVLSAGCHRRPLEEMNDGLYLDIDIDLNIKNCNNVEMPELMRVLFYDAETLEFVSDDYVLAEGGYINAQPGRYKMVVYNFDTESTLIRKDQHLHSLEAYTNDIPSTTRTNLLTKLKANTKADFAPPADGERIVYEPDHLFVAREDVEVLHRTETQTLYASAASVVETYYLAVNLENRKSFASAQALLSGQASGNMFGRENGVIEESVILYFDMTAGTTPEGDDVLETTFNTFGKLPKEVSHLWLTILITNTNGEVVTWQKDITDEFVDNPDRYIYLEEGVTLPEIITPPDGGGGGFQPSVGEWEEIHQDIQI